MHETIVELVRGISKVLLVISSMLSSKAKAYILAVPRLPLWVIPPPQNTMFSSVEDSIQTIASSKLKLEFSEYGSILTLVWDDLVLFFTDHTVASPEEHEVNPAWVGGSFSIEVNTHHLFLDIAGNGSDWLHFWTRVLTEEVHDLVMD